MIATYMLSVARLERNTMTRKQIRDEFDAKVRELCAIEPPLKIDEMACRLKVYKTTVQISFRRQGIYRKMGRPVGSKNEPEVS
jgi:hypothetical protein